MMSREVTSPLAAPVTPEAGPTGAGAAARVAVLRGARGPVEKCEKVLVRPDGAASPPYGDAGSACSSPFVR